MGDKCYYNKRNCVNNVPTCRFKPIIIPKQKNDTKPKHTIGKGMIK